MEIQELKDAVMKLLVSNHQFLPEEAESAVEESASTHEHLWSENAIPEDLAKYVASEEDSD